MPQEIEIEFKNLLTKQEYDQLLSHFNLSPSQAIVQTNHYFETNDFQLKQAKSALRIREKNDLFQLTLKQPHPEGLLETHDTLTMTEAESWINGTIVPKPHVAKQLNELGIDFAQLRYGGSLITHRLETAFKDVVVVLDYSTYNDELDYELELEAKTKASGQQIFDELLHDHKIPKRETPNKIQRFYSTL
ncbi:CYTH domain-containing protein [Aquibacillus koreensis]|uniref:CYTH domain-containing protein n=1 Tax=Aquibacillus koreensis TaxID=279446 RepID=A0A9X4AJ81_9BACI|nr:CYTH domain-containing protein [Aquibacillus koreensis]MCT2535662.1 CYTH domain-containing protein [Aquibacillus koreensis]MDC3420053.1 CYTH domain-containing protein [Aquibacillus koreensis]